MIPRNLLLFKGFIRPLIWKPSTPLMGKRNVFNDNVLRLIKNGNIISNQKNITGTFKKGGLRCATALSNIVKTCYVMLFMDQNIDKMNKIQERKDNITKEDQILSSTDQCVQRKRSCNILSESEIYEKPKSATRKLSKADSSSKKILYRPDYEIVNHSKYNGDPTQTLIIPISRDCSYGEILCYTFHFSNGQNKFICNGCNPKPGKKASAQLSIKDGEEIVELSDNEHICLPVLYAKTKEKLKSMQNLIFEDIDKPYYEIQENGSTRNMPLLTIFTDIERTVGYKMFYDSQKKNYYCNNCRSHNGTWVSAQLKKKEDGTEFLKMRQHVCKSVDLTEVIIKESNYVKLTNNQLFIFSSKESNMGYKYYWCNHREQFMCSSRSCYVSAKMKYDKNNEEYFALSKTEHVCKPIQYQCHISELKQSGFLWPKTNETQCKNVITEIEENHRKYPFYAVTYVITSAPSESKPYEKASRILYVGYTEDCETRMAKHATKDCVVSELIKKLGTLYMIPVFRNISPACHDLEALIYQLWRCGSLKIQLRNRKKCEWKSNDEDGSLKFIAENPDDPRHADLVLGVETFLITQISKVRDDEIITLTSRKSPKPFL